uniref:Uncharacterized protein n=1 Tax=Angiostrongylus cantonensis TaxID=6313 RepID=A0A0K0D8D9_ANGCA
MSKPVTWEFGRVTSMAATARPRMSNCKFVAIIFPDGFLRLILLMLILDMARKRTEKEGSKNAADDVQEDERCIEAVHNGDPELDYRILSIPSLRIQEVNRS